MNRVEIRPVDLNGDTRPFIRFPWRVYADDPHWVPPLIMERKEFFNPRKNPYFKLADVQLFMAWRDGEPVGTISAHVDHGYQSVEAGTGFFGFFEFIDDIDIARSLLTTARDWLRQRGMKRILGPFNFNTNHECGLLVDGFDSDPLVLMTYNRDYYPRIYEALGLQKAKDLYAYWLDPGPMPAQIARIAQRVRERYPEYSVRPVDLKHYADEVELARVLYNDAWQDNWGFVRLTDEEFTKVAKGLKPMIDPRLCFVVEHDKGDGTREPVAFSLTLPDFNQVVKPMNGRILPIGWWYYLTRRSKVDQIRVFTLGVAKAHQRKPIGALLYERTWQAGLEMNIKGAECSWILEDNTRMRGALEKLGARIYKTYRIYGDDL
ncbi:MAG: GNAT family N-acetyltransferase [Deltaproteobacteria bacterium]|nr:MAG: GNAT family N-acetyltransferase [Deltaproteobacteria bacterium]